MTEVEYDEGTALAPAPFAIEPISFDVMAEDIELLRRDYMTLTIEGVEDKRGLAIVSEARREVKKLRCAIDNRRKQIKASSLEYGRKVDSAAKALIDLITPIETYLEHQENEIAEQKRRQEEAAAAERQRALKERMQSLRAYDYPGSEAYIESEVAELSEHDFRHVLELAKGLHADHHAEEKRKEAARQAEDKRLAKERAELEKQTLRTQRINERIVALAKAGETVADVELLGDMSEDQWSLTLKLAQEKKRKRDEEEAAKQRELEAHREAVESQRRLLVDSRRQSLQQYAYPGSMLYEESELAHASAGEFEIVLATAKQLRVKFDEIQAERAAEEARLRAEREEAERRRVEQLKPDHEKIVAYADALDAVPAPDLSEEARLSGAYCVASILSDTTRRIRNVANELLKSAAGGDTAPTESE